MELISAMVEGLIAEQNSFAWDTAVIKPVVHACRIAWIEDTGGEDVQRDTVHGWRADCGKGGPLHPCWRHCGGWLGWHGLQVSLTVMLLTS